MLCMLQRLGVMPSSSRPSVSDDNPYSESLFWSMQKNCQKYPARPFETLNHARQWVLGFCELVQQRTPAQRDMVGNARAKTPADGQGAAQDTSSNVSR
ncbi:integrase catalytic subunit [Candidatus Symbiobacter mobilis CR]|uniref:Integrase catalytic subunit n=1 Tax=Candidatus Symbiobacter mobilis CR TaxID=946483 RepID=U5N4G0_9BURK|nr:integrase catalytic subunit [Candidatus Symbiobacter mobilis CR]